MPAASSSSLHLWLRWLLFALAMGLLVWGGMARVEKRIENAEGKPLSPWEERHLILTRETQKDLDPDFTQSFSAPLKKLAPHRTDGLAQPLWPWIAAWTLDEEELLESLNDLAWFRVGIVLSSLLFLGVICARNFALPAALLIVVMTGLYGFLPTIPEFSGGTLFHLFFLLTWLACLYGLQRNSLWVYGVVGLFGALAYLAEDRILPLLVTFILITTLRAIWGWLAEHWCRMEGTSLWVWSNQTFGLLILAAIFFSITGPRLVEADRLYANGLFSYVDRVRWLDDAQEGKAWIEAHPNREALKKERAVDQLNPATYFQSHPQEQILKRLQTGMHTLGTALADRGGQILLGLLGLLMLLTLTCWWSTPRACHAGERLHPETLTAVLFVVSVSLTFAAIAGWDSAVMSVRHLHALTAPLGLSLIWGCQSVLRRARRRGCRRWLSYGYQAALWGLLAFALL